MRDYERSHPWVSFKFDLQRASPKLWIALGEVQSKCEHVAGIPLQPETAETLHRVYLARGVLATTAIEGNSLSEQEVMRVLDGNLQLPPSRQYQQQEVQNIVTALNEMLASVRDGGIVPLTLQLLSGLNEQVLKGLEVGEDVVPGQIRKDSRVVGRYLCVPAKDCEYLLERFCEWMNGPNFAPIDGHEIVCGVVKAIVAHIYFVWIHPFGDGNGRTARLIEWKFLMEAGVPSDAAHLLSNYYNLTRNDYYRQLDAASKSGGELLPFIEYAVRGFVEQLREQIDVIRDQQIDVTWTNFVHERFQGDNSASAKRRRMLVLALSKATEPVPRANLTKLTPELAAEYAKKTPKTLSRDLNALMEMGLIRRRLRAGYVARKRLIHAFLPVRKPALRKKQPKVRPSDERQLSLI